MNPNTLQLVNGRAKSETFITMECTSELKRIKHNLATWLILKCIPINERSHTSKSTKCMVLLERQSTDRKTSRRERYPQLPLESCYWQPSAGAATKELEEKRVEVWFVFTWGFCVIKLFYILIVMRILVLYEFDKIYDYILQKSKHLCMHIIPE